MISSTGNVLVRAAASSMASGNRSRWRTSVAMCSRSVPLAACGCTARARSTNSTAASLSVSGATAIWCSPSTCSGSRLVASTARPGATQEHVTDDVGHRCGDVLAIVDHDDRRPIPQALGHPLGRRRGDAAVVDQALGCSDRDGDGLGHRARVDDGCELHEPDLLVVGQPAGQLERQPGLAHPGRSDERDETLVVQHRRELVSSRSRPTNDVRASGSDAGPGNGDASEIGA